MFGGAGRRSWPTCTQSLRPQGVRPADALAAADAVPCQRSVRRRAGPALSTTPCRPRARPWSHRIHHMLYTIEYTTGYTSQAIRLSKRCSKGGSIAAHVVSIPIESEHARHVARRVGASPPRHLREHCTRDRQILATHAIVTDEGGHQGAIRGHQGPSEVIRGSRTLRCCTT